MEFKTQWRRRALAAVLFGSAMLGGCATVERQAFNAAAARHIKTVVVAQPANQDEYVANVVGHPGMSFGLIGGLIAAADMQNKSNRLTAAIDPKEVRLQERFTQRLTEQLAAAGYQPTVVTLPKDKKDGDALQFVKAQARGDAIVMVEIAGGYWAAGPQTDYIPRLIAKAKAIDGTSDKILYQDTISYGYAMPQAQTVHLASDPVYRCPQIDVLTADPAKTRAGLYQGIDAVAAQMVSDLKRD